MADFPGFGARTGSGGSGGGFTLGQEQNAFMAATLTAAESARDAYATANPTWLESYNNDTNLNIRLEYQDSGNNVVVYQVRNSAGTAWLNNSSAIGVPGRDGASADLTDVRPNHIPVKNAQGEFTDSGIEIREDGTVVIPESTLGIGDLIELSEGTGFGVIHNNENDLSYVLLDALLSDQTGSARPRQFVIATPGNVDFQTGGTDTLTANPLTFTRSLTGTGSTFNLTFTAVSAMTNAKMRITDVESGVVFKHVPSRIAWEVDDEPGYNLRAGTNTINFFSKDDNDPENGLFNFGISPLIFVAGRQILVEIKADSVSLMGDSASSMPNFSGRFGVGTFRNLAYQDESTGGGGVTPPTRTEDTYLNTQTDNVIANFVTTGSTSADYAVTQILNIPAFTGGNRYVAIAQPSNEPDLTSIQIGNVEQLGAFAKASGTIVINNENYSVWYSNNTLIANVVSGLPIRISRA